MTLSWVYQYVTSSLRKKTCSYFGAAGPSLAWLVPREASSSKQQLLSASVLGYPPLERRKCERSHYFSLNWRLDTCYTHKTPSKVIISWKWYKNHSSNNGCFEERVSLVSHGISLPGECECHLRVHLVFWHCLWPQGRGAHSALSNVEVFYPWLKRCCLLLQTQQLLQW